MAALLKDLYTKEYINSLALNISKFYSSFDINSFTNHIFDSSWNILELKQRMKHISSTLGIFIPLSYNKQIDILIKTYTFNQINIGNRKNKLGLENMIYQDFVEVYGLDDFEISMKALECFTINSSSEFAIRQFILKYEDKTINQMKLWAKSPNEHLRRLASEGCRPRLPWANALEKYKTNPSKVLEILEFLQNDTSLYVKKSIANNLNDISKDNPNIVINIAKNWYGQNEHKNWIIKHACRTLLKQGNPEILEIFGYIKKDNLKINNFNISKTIKIGEDLNFSFDIEDQNILENLRIEYSIDFVRLNKKSNNKVFFITQKYFDTKIHQISKKHSFKLINTRKYYNGIHQINIIVNGIIVLKQKFNLIG